MREFDVVIAGAGISKPLPSRLPDGDQLAELAWRMVVDSMPWKLRELTHGATEQLVAGRNPRETVSRDKHDLRLEQLLEVLRRAIPLDILVGVYRVLGTASANSIHTVLGRNELDLGRIFTLNMDSLIDNVAGKLVTHLHGRWDKPDTIISAIGQYLHGLPPDVDFDFGSAVHGKRVLVLGYSGRDRDVIASLTRHPPSAVHWVGHPGHELTEDASRLRADLERRGTKVDPVDYVACEDFLIPRFLDSGGSTDALVPSGSEPAVSPEWKVPSDALEALGQVPLACRVRGVALVMLEIGRKKDAVELLRHTHAVGREALEFRKLTASGLRSLGSNARAIGLLAIPPACVWDRELREAWLDNRGEVAGALSAMGHASLADHLDNSIVRRGDTATTDHELANALHARARRAQRMEMRGDLESAAQDLDAISRNPDARRLMGLGGYMLAETWRADLLKMKGKYAEATDVISCVIDDLPYGDLTQRAYALWRRAEIKLLFHVDETGVDADLNEAGRLAALANDTRVRFWTLATEADAWGRRDRRRARECQLKAEKLLADVRAFGELYWLLIKAEFARGEDRLDECRCFAEEAVQLSQNRIRLPTGHVSARAAGHLIIAEADSVRARTPGQRNASARRLRDVIDEYVHLGMLSGAARAETSLSIVMGDPLPDDRIAYFRQEGWLREASRALDPSDPALDTWHILM